MKISGIIPARFASTRFPGKPLVNIAGKSMIRRVYEQASKSELLTQVIVATDDERIYEHVLSFGGLVQMTSINHQSGTDRCAEVALNQPDTNVIINIQGDEPFIDPKQIDLLCQCFKQSEVNLATLVKKINNYSELVNNNTPKVIFNKNFEAVYFSRTPVPFLRGYDQEVWLNHHSYYKHIGIYGYRKEALEQITRLPISPLEQAEALEQLRWIENGLHIKIAITDVESIAIDTPQDLEDALSFIDLSKFS